MPIVGHGIDLVENARIQRMIGDHPERFLDRCFTARERADSGNSPRTIEHLSARFAAKEAALKALGTGWAQGVGWQDVETVRLDSGAPELRIHGRAAEIAQSKGITSWLVSLSHTETHSIASVIAQS